MAFRFNTWDERLNNDLVYMIDKFFSAWDRNEALVRNEGPGRLYGNLVREFERIIFNRVVNRSGKIKVYADDTTNTIAAQDLSIVSNALSRIVDLKGHLRQATFTSTYSMGWLYVGHSFAAFGVDPTKYAPIQKNIYDPETTTSQWEEVDQLSVAQRGIDLTQVDAFSVDNDFTTDVDKEPEPVFNDGGFGYPYVEHVSGKHVITPRNLRDIRDADYRARLRLLSRPEVELLIMNDSSIDMATLQPMESKYKFLFEDFDFNFIDEMFLFYEVWVHRDRADFNHNNWMSMWAVNQPTQILRNRKNPWGGLNPLIPVMTTKMGKFLDRTFVDDLTRVSEMYSVTLKSIEQDMKESLNPKILIGAGAQMDKDNVKRILNPAYRGKIDVNGRVDSVKIHRGDGIDQNKLGYANFLRGIAQQTSNTSEIDAGQPIKKISARQTSALVDASDTVMRGMRELVSESAAETIQKLMYILHVFHGNKKEFSFGGNVVRFDPSTTDFTLNAIYRFEVTELGPEASTEDALLMIQAVRSMSSIEEMRQHFDFKILSQQFAEQMRWPRDVVLAELEQPPLPEGAFPPPGMAQAGALGLDGTPGGPNPSRGPGDQADSLEAPTSDNLLQGAFRT